MMAANYMHAVIATALTVHDCDGVNRRVLRLRGVASEVEDVAILVVDRKGDAVAVRYRIDDGSGRDRRWLLGELQVIVLVPAAQFITGDCWLGEIIFIITQFFTVSTTERGFVIVIPPLI